MPRSAYLHYIADAKRTEPDYAAVLGRLALDPKRLRLIHAICGVASESGELADCVKKHIFYGQDLDIENLHEECGDLFWYLALLADCMGETTFTGILSANITKLRERYPEKFTEAYAALRLDKTSTSTAQ